LPIGFYKNGVIIKGYKFHEYNSKEGQTLINDILEGYFPFEIKGKYPDGTCFKIVDHTEEIYDAKAYEKKDNIMTVGKLDEQFRPLTKEEFLNQLPEKVISQGKIIPVREEIAKKMGVLSDPQNALSGIIEIETEIVKQEKKGKIYDSSEITSIKIRSEKGKHTILVKLLCSDKITELYKYADKYSENKGKYVLRRNFPQEEFPKSEAKTLKELGLFPSAALTMQ